MIARLRHWFRWLTSGKYRAQQRWVQGFLAAMRREREFQEALAKAMLDAYHE